MSTRCYIVRKYPDDSYALIFCHSSGDPTCTGAILAEHWLDPDDVENLIQLGSISSIGHSIADYTLTDQNNEADSEPTLHPDFQSILDDLSDDIYVEWMYVFDRGHWMVMEHLYDKDEPGARGARWSEPGPINRGTGNNNDDISRAGRSWGRQRRLLQAQSPDPNRRRQMQKDA